MLLYHAEVHSVSTGIIVLQVKHGRIPPSKGDLENWKKKKKKNSKGLAEHFNFIMEGGGGAKGLRIQLECQDWM